jgi:hypothetical protein
MPYKMETYYQRCGHFVAEMVESKNGGSDVPHCVIDSRKCPTCNGFGVKYGPNDQHTPEWECVTCGGTGETKGFILEASANEHPTSDPITPHFDAAREFLERARVHIEALRSLSIPDHEPTDESEAMRSALDFLGAADSILEKCFLAPEPDAEWNMVAAEALAFAAAEREARVGSFLK